MHIFGFNCSECKKEIQDKFLMIREEPNIYIYVLYKTLPNYPSFHHFFIYIYEIYNYIRFKLSRAQKKEIQDCISCVTYVG